MKWSLSAAAREFGMTERTLGKALSQAHVATGRGARFTTLQIHRALAGDLQSEKIRLTRADADARETSNRVAEGELVSMDAAKKVIAQVLAPVRSKLLALPPNLAVRCNPSDPDLARREIEIAVDEVLKGTQ